MKIAIMGGTGRLGKRLAAALSKKYEVYIGSRDPAKAEAAATRVGVKGGVLQAVAELCDAVILTQPYEAIPALAQFEPALAGKLVISPIVPMRLEGETFYYEGAQGSAAELVARTLGRSRVAAALHTVPSRFLRDPEKLEVDVPVAADDRKTFAETAEIIGSIGKIRPVFAGPLAAASEIERLTPLLLNLAKLNGVNTQSIRFVDIVD